MKTLNKRCVSILAVIAILTTMFCGFGVSAAEADTAGVRAITEKQEELLLHLGILQTPDPQFEEETTRGALAQIASRVAKLPEYTGSEKYFADVPETHQHYKEIYALASVGILAGDGNGYFRPDDPVAPAELCKVFSVILGYDVIGYYETYPVIANRIGLLEGMELNGNVTLGQMLKMVCNTLDLEMMEKITYGDEPEFKVIDGFTALERYHGLVKQTGLVTGAYGTRLTDPDSSIGKSTLIINDRAFVYEDASLLGKAVVFYSRRDKLNGGTENRIEFLYEDDERNQLITVPGEDVIGINGGYFEYYVGSNEKKAQLIGSPDVVVNGVAYPEYTPADLKPDCGSVTLLDNNHDDVFDVILVQEYTFMMIESVDLEEGIIYGKYPDVTVGAAGQDELYQIVMEAGIAGELSFLLSGDVIAVQTSKNTKGSRLITVTYLGEGTAGVIEGIRDDVYTVGGTEYRITDATAMDSDPFLIGQTVMVYSYEGHCAGLIHAENDSYKFGYLIDAKVMESAFSGTLMVRLVTQNRELLELTAGEKVMLDEMQYDDAERMLTQLLNAADLRVLSESLKSTEVAAEAAMRTAMQEGDEEYPYSQPVRYRINNDGVLTHLDTIVKGADETENSLMPYRLDGGTAQAESCIAVYNTNDRNFYLTNKSFYVTLLNAGNLIMPTLNDRDRVEWYGTSVVMEEKNIVEVYTVNENRIARYAVVYAEIPAAVEATQLPYVIADVEKSLNDEGEVVRQVTLYGYGGPYSYTLHRDVPDSQAVVGDVVSCQLNTDREITALDTYYAISQGDTGSKIIEKGQGTQYMWGLNNRMVYGTVLAYSDSIITHTTSVGNEIYKKENLRNYLVGGSTSCYRYTNKGGTPKVEMANPKDLIPYSTDPKTAQRTILITNKGRLDTVYIIDKD